MTLENLKKKHAQLKWLASGEFTERDFDYKIKKTDNPEGDIKHQGEGGWSTMGEMKPERKQLIQQDAARTLKNFERKHPEFKKAEGKISMGGEGKENENLQVNLGKKK